MTRQSSSYLKLHVDRNADSTASSGSAPQSVFSLQALTDAFANATGWLPRPLTVAQSNPLAADPQVEHDAPVIPLRNRVRLVSNSPIDGALEIDGDENLVGENEAWALLEQIDGLIQGMQAAERVIERQEAQLAATVSVSLRNDEADLLNHRFKECLHRAVEQTGSDAAALYLLDETTSDLKMRSCVGLPTLALSQPARPLRGSLADLEALMGNAVLIENTQLAKEWNCPEDFAAGLCLPIGSPTMPHGTLWLWSEHVRDFGQTDVECAKSAAEKILVNIERSVLANEVLNTRALDRQFEAAGVVQASRLPSLQQLHHDYEVGGWTFQGQALGGNFHTWTINRHQHICAALGAAYCNGAAGALVATSMQTVVETCWNAKHHPSQILRKANDLLWDVEEGDWRSALCYVQVHPESGSMQLALAGDLQAFIVGPRGFRMIQGTPTLLAEQPDTRFINEQHYLEGGELLAVASANVVGGAAGGGFSQDAFLETIRKLQDEAVEDIADYLARKLPVGPAECERDRSLMIIRRRF